jgi:hypothetical protein
MKILSIIAKRFGLLVLRQAKQTNKTKFVDYKGNKYVVIRK